MTMPVSWHMGASFSRAIFTLRHTFSMAYLPKSDSSVCAACTMSFSTSTGKSHAASMHRRFTSEAIRSTLISFMPLCSSLPIHHMVCGRTGRSPLAKTPSNPHAAKPLPKAEHLPPDAADEHPDDD